MVAHNDIQQNLENQDNRENDENSIPALEGSQQQHQRQQRELQGNSNESAAVQSPAIVPNHQPDSDNRSDVAQSAQVKQPEHKYDHDSIESDGKQERHLTQSSLKHHNQLQS